MPTTLSTTKLAGGSIKTVVRRIKRIAVEMPDGKSASVYLEQEDVTYIDGERVGSQGVDVVPIGPKDVADEDHLVALQELATTLDDRVTVNEANRSERDKAAKAAEAAIADAEEIAIIDEK